MIIIFVINIIIIINTLTSHLYVSQIYDSFGFTVNFLSPVYTLWEIMLNFPQSYVCFTHVLDAWNGLDDITFLNKVSIFTIFKIQIIFIFYLFPFTIVKIFFNQFLIVKICNNPNRPIHPVSQKFLLEKSLWVQQNYK